MKVDCPECEELVKQIHGMQQDRLHLSKRLAAIQKVVDAARLVFGPNRPVTRVSQAEIALHNALAELDKETTK